MTHAQPTAGPDDVCGRGTRLVNGWFTWGFAAWLFGVLVLKSSVGTGHALLIATSAAAGVTLLLVCAQRRPAGALARPDARRDS